MNYNSSSTLMKMSKATLIQIKIKIALFENQKKNSHDSIGKFEELSTSEHPKYISWLEKKALYHHLR